MKTTVDIDLKCLLDSPLYPGDWFAKFQVFISYGFGFIGTSFCWKGESACQSVSCSNFSSSFLIHLKFLSDITHYKIFPWVDFYGHSLKFFKVWLKKLYKLEFQRAGTMLKYEMLLKWGSVLVFINIWWQKHPKTDF